MSSTNSLLDINKIYLNQVAEGGLKSLEKASVLAMSDKPEDQDKAREIKTRFDYQSMLKQKKAKKAVKEEKSNWRHDLREIITAQKDTEEPEIKEKKVKNKVTINPKLGEAVEQLGGKLLSVQEMVDDEKEDEKEKAQTKAIEAKQKRANQVKKQVLFRKLQALRSGAEDITAGYEPEGGQIDEIQMPKNTKYARMSYKKLKKTHKDFKNMESKPPRVTVLDKDTNKTVSRPVKFVPESEQLKKAKINFNTSKKGGKTIYKVNKNDESDAQKAMKNDPKYISGKTRVQAHQEAYGGKGSSRKARLSSIHPPTAKAAIKNIPDDQSDRGSGNKAKKRMAKMSEARVDQGKDDAAKINTRNQRAFGNRRGQKGGGHLSDDMEKRRENTRKGRGVKMKGKKDKTPVDYHGQDRKKRIDALFKEATRYSKETGKSFKTGKPVVKGGTAKDDKAFQAVAKKYSGQMMGGQQKKKVRGQKPDDSNTPFKRAAARIKQVKADNKAFASRAKKAGFKSTQDYANTVARYGGEKDYQNPNKRGGLGS